MDDMNNRGQITIEAILILGLFILIFIAVTFSMGLRVQEYSNDLAIATEARANLDKISDGIMIVRAGGPGTTKTVTITSTFNNWSIATGNNLGRNQAIIYGIGFSNSNTIPDEMNSTGPISGLFWGTFGEDISGINAGNSITTITVNGAGTWNVMIKHNATGLIPTINLAPAAPALGETINITLT